MEAMAMFAILFKAIFFTGFAWAAGSVMWTFFRKESLVAIAALVAVLGTIGSVPVRVYESL